MSGKTVGRRRTLGIGAAAGVAGILTALAVIYGIGAGKGNVTATCSAQAATLERLAPLARGEVAALIVAEESQPIPQFSFTDEAGGQRSIADFRGRTVLLNLWATWCVPCREEMPTLDRLQADLGDDGFEVVAVNIDTEARERADAFLDEIGVRHLTRYADPTMGTFTALKKAGLVVGLPASVLIAADGCRLAHINGPAAWDSPDAKAVIAAAASPAGG